ncbi:Leucine-rich repeat and immunoglobulin-like domain-containing nogo receptor-interacting protein 1-B, partial [Clarias magur]
MKRAPLLAFIKAHGPCGLALDVRSGVEPVDLTGHYGISSWERLEERLRALTSLPLTLQSSRFRQLRGASSTPSHLEGRRLHLLQHLQCFHLRQRRLVSIMSS